MLGIASLSILGPVGAGLEITLILYPLGCHRLVTYKLTQLSNLSYSISLKFKGVQYSDRVLRTHFQCFVKISQLHIFLLQSHIWHTYPFKSPILHEKILIEIHPIFKQLQIRVN